MSQVPARTTESDAMSRDLVRRGFKFVGSTICYAMMQATGMVNDHLGSCPRYSEFGGPRRRRWNLPGVCPTLSSRANMPVRLGPRHLLLSLP